MFHVPRSCMTEPLSDKLKKELHISSSSSNGAVNTSDSSTNAPKLLLVEDNKIALFTLENLVRQAGCVFFSAMDGERALDLSQTQPFDLIITDLGLPGLSGIDLTIRIRLLEQELQKAPIPIIGLTAHSEEHIKQECLQAGMNEVYTKPMTSAVLASIKKTYFA